jgi:three-Cys-motif partner protein
MAEEPRYCQGDDGLIVERVGVWVEKKHKILRDYVFAAGGARQKYSQRAYIDVFCGPGRAQVRSTGQFVDGSSLVAFKAAQDSAAEFTSIEISDARSDLVDANKARLEKLRAPVRIAPGPAVNSVKEIVARLDPYGLHLAFLDPHNLGTLSMSLFAELAKLKRVDCLVHVSVADLQRNADRYSSADYDQFDEFAPGWRSKVGTDMNKQAFRSAIVNYWSDEVERLGLPRAEHCELVTASKDQRLYWLILLARHNLAHALWSRISSEAQAPKFDF